MDMLSGLFRNRILITAVAAWVLSQLIKTGLYTAIRKEFDWRRLIGDGGMPSTHSAAVTAAATACGIHYGLDSGLFGLAVLLAFITCHDAMNSRQEIGKQAAVLRELTKEQELEIALKEFVGHTPAQVAVGIVLGLAVGLAVNLL